MKPEDVTIQIKALDEYILTVLFVRLEVKEIFIIYTSRYCYLSILSPDLYGET